MKRRMLPDALLMALFALTMLLTAVSGGFFRSLIRRTCSWCLWNDCVNGRCYFKVFCGVHLYFTDRSSYSLFKGLDSVSFPLRLHPPLARSDLKIECISRWGYGRRGFLLVV